MATDPPATLDQRIRQALALFEAGDADGARGVLENVIAQHASNPAPHLVLGAVNLNSGRPGDALASLDRSLALDPSNPRAHSARGVALSTLGRHAEAVDSHARALTLAPRYAEAYVNRGTALRNLERLAEARADFDMALRLNPNLLEAHYSRAHLDAFEQNFPAALQGFDRALALFPGHVRARVDKAAVLSELGRGAEALAMIEETLAIAPVDFGARFGRASALARLNRLDDALAAGESALAGGVSDADRPQAELYMSWLLGRLHRLDDAIARCERAAQSDALRAEALWKQSMFLLQSGRLKEGFRLYEHRKQVPRLRHAYRVLPDAPWDGKAPIKGKRIFVYAEQGFGDTIQFARYVSLLAQAGARVTLEVQPALTRLFATLAGVDRLTATGEDPGPYDHHISLLSLPMAFGTELDSVPSSPPYLAADPTLAHTWAQRLDRTPRPRIGLVWQGNHAHLQDHERSVQLTDLLAALPRGPSYLAVQREISSTDETRLKVAGIASFGSDLTDFAQTAALIDTLDLVISVDTSVAHLAGALGKPVFILLHHSPDWRWLLARTDTPWYPAARLFRQTHHGDWSSALDDLSRAIAAFSA